MKGAHGATRLKGVISDLSMRQIYGMGGETAAFQAPTFQFESISPKVALLPVLRVATVRDRE
jgi:hypothetical protein